MVGLHDSELAASSRASVHHPFIPGQRGAFFQQRAVSVPLRNRGLGPLAMTVLPIALAGRGTKVTGSAPSVQRPTMDGREVPKPAVSRCSNMPCAEGRVIPAAGTSDYCGSLCSGRRLLRRPYGFIPFYLLFERVVFAKPVSTFAGDTS